MRTQVLAPLLLVLAGCAPSLLRPTPQRIHLKNYEIGETRRGAVGEPIFDVQTASRVPVYVAAMDLVGPKPGLLSSGPRIQQGQTFSVVGEDASDGTLVIHNPVLGDFRIKISRAGQVIGGGWTALHGGALARGDGWPAEPLFHLSDEIEGQKGAFRAQIIYSGITGNTVRAVYREFVDDFARPAFSQELQYDLNESRRLSYKSVDIDILNATNSFLEYRVAGDKGLPWLPGGSVSSTGPSPVTAAIPAQPASPVRPAPRSQTSSGPWVAHAMSGEVFWHECAAARNVASRWRREYATLEEARKAGYTLSRTPECQGPTR